MLSACTLGDCPSRCADTFQIVSCTWGFFIILFAGSGKQPMLLRTSTVHRTCSPACSSSSASSQRSSFTPNYIYALCPNPKSFACFALLGGCCPRLPCCFFCTCNWCARTFSDGTQLYSVVDRTQTDLGREPYTLGHKSRAPPQKGGEQGVAPITKLG